jgi:hypothetical protein
VSTQGQPPQGLTLGNGEIPKGFAVQERGEIGERSKIMVGRTPQGAGKQPRALWWRITIYAGDSREIIDRALEEALRIDGELQERAGS